VAQGSARFLESCYFFLNDPSSENRSFQVNILGDIALSSIAHYTIIELNSQQPNKHIFVLGDVPDMKKNYLVSRNIVIVGFKAQI
jgi:hypothetical protein